MIPILYEKTETAFRSNGLGRLRDVISCIVTEERNGVYELDFDYPVDGINYDKIQLGRIVAVEHDDTNDVQPFDIVSSTEPLEGVVTFHCVHISYRLNKITVSGKGINSLASAFALFQNSSVPSNSFTYWTDKTSTGYLASADGIPRTVRSMLGGVEGSVLDAYGGEYEFDRFTVKLWQSRGQARSLTIRYGVNLSDYNRETDCSEAFTAVVPYWADENTNTVVKGGMISSGATSVDGRESCVPLDLTEKFENKPTAAQLESMAAAWLSENQPYLATQSINVSFVRLQDSEEYEALAGLMQCRLCDTVKVVFPQYKVTGRFKIVKTVYDVLLERFEEMELGTLSTTLAEALGISGDGTFSDRGMDTAVIELPIESEFKLGESQVPIKLFVYGHVCCLRGFVYPKATIQGGTTEHIICTIPTEYRPTITAIYTICQGSGNAEWLCRVGTEGNVSFARYRNTASAANAYIDANTSQWLPFNITWIIE